MSGKTPMMMNASALKWHIPILCETKSKTRLTCEWIRLSYPYLYPQIPEKHLMRKQFSDWIVVQFLSLKHTFLWRELFLKMLYIYSCSASYQISFLKGGKDCFQVKSKKAYNKYFIELLTNKINKQYRDNTLNKNKKIIKKLIYYWIK